MKRVTLCCICLVLLLLCACRMNVQENVPWPDNEWTRGMPKYSETVDALRDESKDGKCDIVITIKEAGFSAFCDYVAQMEEAGFTDDYEGQLIPEKEPNSYASFLSSNKGIMVMINWYSQKYPARPLCDMQIQIQSLETEDRK